LGSEKRGLRQRRKNEGTRLQNLPTHGGREQGSPTVTMASGRNSFRFWEPYILRCFQLTLTEHGRVCSKHISCVVTFNLPMRQKYLYLHFTDKETDKRVSNLSKVTTSKWCSRNPDAQV
jgi:hypothetical protein